MTRNAVALMMTMFAVAAGCSASSNGYFTGDGGTEDAGPASIKPGDASTSSVTDSGKKKDSGKDTGTTEEEDAGVIDEDSGTTTFDAGKKDSGTVGFDASTGPTCAPDSISGFTPTWIPPAALHSSACTTQQADTAVTCALDSTANQTTCQAFNNNSANSACLNCVFTSETATSQGAVILDSNNLVRLNISGCIAHKTNNLTSTNCGAKLQALLQCEEFSCESVCPVSDQASVDALIQCEADAETTSCASYSTAAACADPLLGPDGGAESCVQGVSFIDRAKNLAHMFCTP